MADTIFRSIDGAFPTGTSTFDLLIPSETRTPTGCIVLSSYAESLDTAWDDMGFSFGLTDFTTVGHIAANDAHDEQITTNSRHWHQEVDIIQISTPGGATIIRTATVAAIPGGIRLTPGESGTSYRVMATIIFGSACKAFSSRMTDLAIDEAFDFPHTFATEPGAGFYGYTQRDENGGNTARFNMGFHAYDGTIEQGCASWSYDNGETTVNNRARTFNDRCISSLNESGDERRALEITAIDTTNITYTQRTVANDEKYIGLLVECDDVSTSVQFIDSAPTSGDWNFTDLTFEPQFVAFILNNTETVDVMEGDLDAGVGAFATMDAAARAYSQNWAVEDFGSLPATNTQSRLDTKCVLRGDEGSVGYTFHSPVFNSTGWFMADADISADTTVRQWPMLAIEGVAGGEETGEALFTCNGILSLGTPHKDNLDRVLSSMDGKLSYSSGEWKIRASLWEISSLSITPGQLVGPVSVRGSAPRSSRFNTVRGVFIDPAREYDAVEFPHVSKAAYVTRDAGKVLEFDLQLPMTNDVEMAQQLAFRVLEQGNNQQIIDFTMNASGAEVEIGQIADITVPQFSYSAKTFRIIDWSPNALGNYDIVGREDFLASYVDQDPDDLGGGTGSLVTIPAFIVPAPTNLSAHPVPVGIKIDWRNPPTNRFDFIDIYCSGDNQFDNAVVVASIRSNSYVDATDSGETRFYWVQARLLNGEVSLREPDSDTSTITAIAGNTGGCTFDTLGNKNLNHEVTSPTDANTGFRIDNDGFIYTRLGTGAWVQQEKWIGSCTNANYESRMAVTGTAYTTGTVDTWQLLSSNRTWELLETGIGQAANSGVIEIRRIDDDVVGRTATIDMAILVES